MFHILALGSRTLERLFGSRTQLYESCSSNSHRTCSRSDRKLSLKYLQYLFCFLQQISTPQISEGAYCPSDGHAKASGIWILLRMLNFVARAKFNMEERQTRKKKKICEFLEKKKKTMSIQAKELTDQRFVYTYEIQRSEIKEKF